MIAKLLKMQSLEDEDELAYTSPSEEQAPKREADGRPSWMRTLHNSASSWLKLIPQSLHTLRRTVDNIKDPLYRYFEREVRSMTPHSFISPTCFFSSWLLCLGKFRCKTVARCSKRSS